METEELIQKNEELNNQIWKEIRKLQEKILGVNNSEGVLASFSPNSPSESLMGGSV